MFVSQLTRAALVAVLAIGSLASCSSMYYGTMEAFGQHKRDLLVGRVADARDDQVEAKEQFQSALDHFTSLVEVPDSDLRRLYDELSDELDRSESTARALRKQIADIETVGEDLFAEWETELAQYTSEQLRRNSRATMDETRVRYDQMVTAMKRPEAKMEQVLVAFRDHVLFLKHNLNAQAVASLQGTVGSLELDTAQLIAEMEAAIAEADAFIQGMEPQAAARWRPHVV
jgi:DNA-directed RNA polymerase subunit F